MRTFTNLFYRRNDRWDDGITGFSIFVGVLALVFCVFLGIFAIATTVDRRTCRNEGQTTGMAWKYTGGFIDTCYLKIDGRWIPDTTWIQNTGN